MPKKIEPKGEPKKIDFKGYMDERLYALVEADALTRCVPLSHVVAEAVAKAYGRPDLAAVPRKMLGRPLGRRDGTPRKRGPNK